MADNTPDAGGERVNVINPFGRLVSVAASDAEVALAGGYSQPTAEQVQKYQAEQKYGGAAGMAGAAGLGVLRGVTAGLSDKALVEMARLERGDAGASQMADKLGAIAEVNPTLSTAGEIGGYAGGGALMGTAKLGAKATMLAGGGTRGAMAGAAATGAVEGAVMGFGEEVSAATLEQRELDGEQLVASMGFGAVAGGAFGGALALGGAGVRAGKNKLLAAMRRGGGDIGDQIGAKASRAWSGTAEAFGVENASAVEKFSPLTKAGREAFDVVQSAPERLTKQAQQAADGLEGMWGSMQAARARFSGASKRKHVERSISRETSEAAIEASRGQLAQMRRELDVITGQNIVRPPRKAGDAARREWVDAKAAHRGTYGLQSQAKKAREAVIAAERRMAKESDSANALMDLDELKRTVGHITARGETDLSKLPAKERATRERFEQAYQSMRTHLEREDLWGGAAALQRDMNVDWAGFLETQRVSQFGKRFTKRAPKRGAFAGSEEIIDKEKLFASLVPPKLTGGPTDLVKTEQHEAAKNAVREWLNDADRFLTSSDKALGKNAQALVGGFRSDARGLKNAMGELDRITDLQHEWTALGAGGAGAMPAAATGFALGALGPAAAPVAALGSAIADPKRAIRQVYALRELGGKAAAGVSRAGAKLRRVAPLVRRVTVHSAMAARERDRSERAAKAATDLDPVDMERRAQQRFAGVSPGAPMATDAAVATAVRGAAYLKQHAPQRRGRPDVLGSPYLAPSDHELEIFERRRKVVQRPLSVVTSITDGSITREAVDAFDAVYPRLATDTREAYRDELTKLTERGEQLPYQQACALELLLGQPLVGINHPETVMAIQASYRRQQAPPQRQQPKSGAPDVADMYDRNDSLQRELTS